MKRFTNNKNKVATAISTALLLASNYAFATDNLIQQGDFEGSYDLWVATNAVRASTVTSGTGDGDTTNKVLKLENRTGHAHSAKHTVSGLIAGHTYSFTAKLKTDSPGEKVSVGTSYRLNGAARDTYVTIGEATASSGAWVDYSASFTLPADFDDTKNFKIWIKSAGGSVSTLYGDDLVLVDRETTYTSEAWNVEYWTANDILGDKLDIMRLSYSDAIGNNDEVNAWLKLNSDWRWALPDEMRAIHTFIDAGDMDTTLSTFKALNGGVWSPHVNSQGVSTEQWLAIIPGYKLVAKNSGIFWTNVVAKSANAGSATNAALLVRAHDDNPSSGR